MIRKAAYILVAIGFMIVISCSSRKNDTERSDIIPQKELTEVLIDIYLTDGLLNLPEVYHRYTASDTLGAYKDVIQKHGFTKEQMDKTMRFYFIKKPKQLIRIYDRVLAKLSEMEARNEKAAEEIENQAANQWRGRKSYQVPGTSGSDSATFDFTLIGPGTFDLTFTAVVYPDDQTSDPRLRLYACHPDSLQTGKRHYFSFMPHLKDGISRNFMYRIVLPDRSFLHLHGSFVNSENQGPEVKQHFIIEKIALTNVYGAS